MATIQRPTKEGSVRTYQEKVGLGYVDILASEMDADLDTIYAAWNGGVDSTTLNDLSVSTAKLADGAVTAAKLGAPAPYLPLAGGTLTGQLRISEASQPVDIRNGGVTRMYVTNNGTVVVSNPGATSCNHEENGLSIWRGPTVVSLTSSATSKLELSGAGGPSLCIAGGSSGIRYQAVGTTGGDGYSNVIAFGWNGTLQARVDGSVIGTVTVTSDARVKLDVQEDVPGLAAVLALRPISFAYDQTKREIGFPKGCHYGLVAQEVQPHAPLVVVEDNSDDHWQEIDYRVLVPVLIRAVQELAARLDALQAPA